MKPLLLIVALACAGCATLPQTTASLDPLLAELLRSELASMGGGAIGGFDK